MELGNVVGMSVSVYHILCKAVPNGDLSFQVPPIAMSLVILFTFGEAVMTGSLPCVTVDD